MKWTVPFTEMPWLYKSSIQVVSLFAITGGLAVDCVRQGHTEYLAQLVEGIAAVIEDELVVWINENGGWVRMFYRNDLLM